MKTPEDEAFEEIERIQRTRTKWVAVEKKQNDTDPPKYAIRVHWEKDRRIGVVAAVVRPDGGIHLLQETIDPPQRTWVGLTVGEVVELDLATNHPREFAQAIEAKLKEKNNA
jgi:hypothetical protein